MKFLQSIYGKALIILLAFVSPVFAEETEVFHVRTHRQVYSDTGASQRAKGLGGSYAALSNGAGGVIENPAGLGAQTKHELMTDIGISSIDGGSGDGADVVSINVGGSININATAPHYYPRENTGNHTVGLMVHYNGVDYTGRDSLTSGLTGLTLAYGRSFQGGQYFGGTSLKYSEGEYDDDDLTIDQILKRWEWKVGVIARVLPELALGATFSYGRGSINDEALASDNDGEVTHFELRVGAALQISEDLMLVADITREDLDTIYTSNQIEERHNIWTLSTGIESPVIPEVLTLRGGIYYTHDDYDSKGVATASTVDDYFGISLGMTYYHSSGLQLGYSLDIRDGSDIGNFFNLQFEW